MNCSGKLRRLILVVPDCQCRSHLYLQHALVAQTVCNALRARVAHRSNPERSFGCNMPISLKVLNIEVEACESQRVYEAR